jgi:hypothetical protein
VQQNKQLNLDVKNICPGSGTEHARISTGTQYVTADTVKLVVKKLKCAGLAQEIGFFAPNSCSMPWLVKGAIQLCTSKKSNKLDLTAAQYF